MKNSESLQLVKEQLKIKSIEFRKVEENNTTVNKKIKTLITENQEEVKKLKSAIVKKDTEIQQREREIRSSSDRLKEAQELAKQVSVRSLPIQQEEQEWLDVWQNFKAGV